MAGTPYGIPALYCTGARKTVLSVRVLYSTRDRYLKQWHDAFQHHAPYSTGLQRCLGNNSLLDYATPYAKTLRHLYH